MMLLSAACINYFVDYLNKNEGALMVVITFVYVLVTVLIWVSNSISAKATRKQVETSQAQYNETKRREMMPCFYISVLEEKTDQSFIIDLTNHADGKIALFQKLIVLENVGKGIAKDITWLFHCDVKRDVVIEKGILLPPSNKSNKHVTFDADLTDKDHQMPYLGQFEIQCTDMEDNCYCQYIDVSLVPIPTPHSTFLNMVFEVKRVSAPKLIKKQSTACMKEKKHD